MRLITVVSVAVLLPGAGSVKPAGRVTEAVFARMPWADAGTIPRTVNVARPPPDRVTVLLMWPAPLLEAQLDPGAATQVHVAPIRLAGMTSDTTTSATAADPLFVTTTV